MMRIHQSAARRRMRLRTAIIVLLSAACGDAAPHEGETSGRVAVDSGALASAVATDSAAPALADTALAPSQTTATADAPAVRGATTQPGPGAPASEPAAAPPSRAAGSPAGSASHAPAPASPAAPAAADSPSVQQPSASMLPTTPEPPSTTAPGAPARKPVPFAPGEKLTFDVKFGPLRVGSAVLEVRGIEQVRGTSAWHTRFTVKGSALGVKVDDLYESWFDVTTLSSLRHLQDVDEGPYERKRTFEIFPDRRVYVEQVEGKEPREAASVALPLDDGSFIYFIRAMPELEVGKTYTFENYFRPDRNPVRITVLRRERIEVPAGRFDAIVLRPSIKTKGIFSEGGNAELWLANDSTRTLLQLKSKLAFGSLNLYLRKRSAGAAP